MTGNVVFGKVKPSRCIAETPFEFGFETDRNDFRFRSFFSLEFRCRSGIHANADVEAGGLTDDLEIEFF